MVRTPASHVGNAGSSPAGTTNSILGKASVNCPSFVRVLSSDHFRWGYDDLANAAERLHAHLVAQPRVALASRAFRNILAHATLDVSEGALHKEEISGVGFVRYKDGERAVYYV